MTDIMEKSRGMLSSLVQTRSIERVLAPIAAQVSFYEFTVTVSTQEQWYQFQFVMVCYSSKYLYRCKEIESPG